MAITMTFGKNLRELRLNREWTQLCLADKMGKSKNNISQYERGLRQPTLEQLVQFADLFGVTTDELLGYTKS
ncbi:MAG: helix-turn-helix transcriptional regulator [Clostridia bacterium]